jgi:hypothetical protein
MKTVDRSVDAMAYRYPRLRLDAKGNPSGRRDPVRFFCDVALRLQLAEAGALGARLFGARLLVSQWNRWPQLFELTPSIRNDDALRRAAASTMAGKRSAQS